MKPSTYQDEPRETAEEYFECHAPEGYFARWEDVPDDYKAEIATGGPLPCDGGGVVGYWCRRCRFGEYSD